MPDIPLYGSFQKTFFKKDKITIDNALFRLHHQVSSALVIFGIIFIFAENYLDGNSIKCTGGNDYQTRFCWLHGAGYVAKNLQKQGVTNCFMTEETGDEGSPKTAYYVWLPFLLVACLGLSKLPRTLWKSLEQGIMEELVGEPGGGQSEHAAKGFMARRKKNKTYQLSFFLCELFNIVCVLVSMAICNGLLRGKFWSYGSDIHYHYNEYDAEQRKTHQPANPMCNIFPTEVSCRVLKGGIAQNADSEDLLCLLSNNLFNQYYFAILWFWWVSLLILSGLGAVFVVVRTFIPGFNNELAAYQFKYRVNEMPALTVSDIFVLGMLSNNLAPGIMGEVIDKIKMEKLTSTEMTEVISPTQVLIEENL